MPRTLKIILLALAISLSACRPEKAEQKVDAPVMVGGDQDAHGCKGSAGYTWSVMRAECIRIFEAGVPLESTAAGATSATFVIESVDRKTVEVFIPEESASIIMHKVSDALWADDKNAYVLETRGDKKYVLKGAGGKVLYQAR